MSVHILHVSDLHTGTHEDPEVATALARLVTKTSPDLIVASGDLTNRGRRDEHERAHRFLLSLGAPVLAVPGNHDLPYTVPARFTSPLAEFERVWGTAEPTHVSAGLHVVGLNSARPYRQQGGSLDASQLRAASERLGSAAEGAYRVVVLHHQLLSAPWGVQRKRPLSDRSGVLRALVAADADLILGGHTHQGAVNERREFEFVDGDARATVLSTAPGFGRPRPGRLREARGLQVYEVDETTLTVSTHTWRDGDFALDARRTFPRGLGPLA